MRHLLDFALACLVCGACCGPAAAQVYQCKDAAGKNVFSQTPCSAHGGNGEKLLVRTPMPAAPAQDGAALKAGAGAPPPRDWAAENAAANARAAAGGTRSSQASWPPLHKGSTTPAPKSDRQIVAECETGRGARCNSAGEIAERRDQQRQLTPAEQRQQQDAIAARRQRQFEESMNRR